MFGEFPLLRYSSFQLGIILPKGGRDPLSQVFSPKMDEIGSFETSVGVEDDGASYYITQFSSQPSPEGLNTSE